MEPHATGNATITIPAEKLEWFRTQIAEMRGIYADGIAREVAEELGCLLML
ncbi:hypothetical protein [Gordonibacter sp. Marseille-P4307]|uniref:hypothetical protein n=1 Tax=Gordonibacter sp. Marseille-P4307 TaxID=2161815 RepID=UPI0013DE4861|nr:hypothetical protein [Gordonibacter sp. Marseille-P4307]